MPESDERRRAFLSNGFTSALELDGSIDWFPCPRFDSPSIFSAILDRTKGGFFSIRPEADYKLASQYIGNNMMLRNVFETEKGRLEVTDFLPLGVCAIIRIFKSEVPFIAEVRPVFQYGMTNSGIETSEKGITFKNGSSKEGLELSIKGDYSIIDDGLFRINAGEGYMFALYSKDLKYGLFSRSGSVYPDPYETFEATQKYWDEQLSSARPVGKFRDAYYRSLAVVLGLMYMPSGGMIAAPSASLPEIVGKSRNWDYRYVWVRDAAYAAETLSNVMMLSKARRALSFLISVIDPSLKSFDHPFYSIDGTAPQPEETLHWLRGHRGSRPVRIGNEAFTHMQNDVEGAFMSGMHAYIEKSGDLLYAKENWWAVEAIAKWTTESWRLKSISLWEERDVTEHYVHTKVMEWVALDRAVKIGRRIGENKSLDGWTSAAVDIKAEIMKEGYSGKLNSFTKFYGSDEVDASLLVLPLYGFIDAKDPMFLSTLQRIEKTLAVDDGLLIRYSSDFMGKVEHPFTLLSTWLARVYLRLGDIKRAETIIDRLLYYSNDNMLIAEHIDLKSREPRGNIPQLFAHVGLIEAINELNDPTLLLQQ
ncbi:MAG: glycoside hydrolase family 15 protein [Candidatus Micrarchaeota archaeon]|nr:glycoside hydrolase family 15 protein [Candidatus Micrarchaeota archaeon]MDE1849142.1 glycoside hydrolase family 15 protein [Candidatus Micrarchaeota archaeon]